jgi:hypothetical protein
MPTRRVTKQQEPTTKFKEPVVEQRSRLSVSEFQNNDTKTMPPPTLNSTHFLSTPGAHPHAVFSDSPSPSSNVSSRFDTTQRQRQNTEQLHEVCAPRITCICVQTVLACAPTIDRDSMMRDGVTDSLLSVRVVLRALNTNACTLQSNDRAGGGSGENTVNFARTHGGFTMKAAMAGAVGQTVVYTTPMRGVFFFL